MNHSVPISKQSTDLALASLSRHAHQKETASETVIHAVKSLLMEGVLSVGDRLPNEFAIAESLKVSRGSVREAMKILSAMGVVVVKRGDGTYISDQMGVSMIEQLMMQLVKRETDARELSEIREMIELGIVRLGTLHRTDAQIEKLWQVLARQRQEVEEGMFDLDHLIASEFAFHQAMVDCANNELLKTLYLYILELYLPAHYEHLDYEYHMRTALHVHRPVIEAIENQDPEAGAQAIRETTRQWVEITESGGEQI